MKKVEIKALDPKAKNYDEKLDKILAFRTRAEKIMVKDAKLRTFITQDDSRDEMVAHVYDITYGSLRRNEDTVVVIDDSIVRGTTAIKIVEMIRDAGAAEVHMRISSPPIRYPDYYGIDTPRKDELLASIYSLEEMKNKLKLDSLYFLSIDGLYKSMGFSSRNIKCSQFTDHCFTGDYPTELTDRDEGTLSSQLSLLSNS